MNNRIRQKFEQVLTAATHSHKISGNNYKIFSDNNNNCIFALSGEGLFHYDELIQSILRIDDWQKKFSKKYITGAVNKILSELLNQSNLEKLPIYIEELNKEYSEFSFRQTIYLPVKGLFLENSEVKIGNVRFLRPSQDIFESIITQARPIIYSTENSTSEQDYFMEEFSEDLSKYFSMNKGNIFAKTSFVAEPIRAKERAEEEVRRSLEILRIFIPLDTILLEPKEKIQIGLEGEIISGSRFSISMTETNLNTSHDNTGGIKSLILNSENLDIMSRNGFSIFSDILAKDQINSYENALLRAVHWFSASRMQLESENALLNLITSIEVLLTPRNGDPIGTAIAEALALLLEDSFESRKRIKDRFKKLYRCRSAVSHGGKNSDLKSDLYDLIQLAYSLLIYVCKNHDKFNDHESLIRYIEELKLS